MASDPEKESVVDMSVVVNLDERTVSGLWSDRDVSGNYLHNALPIRAFDANSVCFSGRKGKKTHQSSIEGTVDRITGKIDATESWLWSNGSLDTLDWDLRCKPTRPLF
jgi:hypothetical protein